MLFSSLKLFSKPVLNTEMICNKKKCIEGTLSFFISLSCFAFVSWQSGKCISKYIQDPQATKLSLENTANHQQFPAITICKDWKANEKYGSIEVEDDLKYDMDILNSCGIRYYNLIARFIWNAEISVSVAIHCYERLF